jgi:predicted transcriptional regulator of viral defense system
LFISGKYNNIILSGDKMIKDTAAVMQELKAYASPKAKLTRMLKNGDLIQIRRGLFSDTMKVSSFELAAVIYGPSYISFQSALSFYGLIPERTLAVTCASYNKNKNKTFSTPFGSFYYYYLPAKVYPYGITSAEADGSTFLIACREKALLDLLYKTNGISSYTELENLLFDDLRMEADRLAGFDTAFISMTAAMYNSRTVQLFSKWIIKEYADAKSG